MTKSALVAISEAFHARDGQSIMNVTSDTIVSILEGTSRSKECIDASFSHKLGFDKFVLIDDGVNGLQLRVHCWRDRVAEMPHDHPWSFQSFVLSGELFNAEYRRDYAGRTYQRKIARSDFSTNGFSYRLAEDQTLVVARRRRISAGKMYSMASHAIHATRVITGPTITIFLRSGVSRYESSTYVLKDTSLTCSFPMEYRPSAFSSTQYLKRLEGILGVLGSAQRS